MKRFLLLVTVALIGLVAGAVITGRPQTVPSDLRAADIRPTTSTAPATTTSTTTTTSSTTTSTTEPPTSTSEAAVTTDGSTSTSRLEAAETTIATTAAPATEAPTTTDPPLAPVASLFVMVGNASNTYGLATHTAAALGDMGYLLVYRADGVREVAETRIYADDGLEAEAARLAESIGLDPDRVGPRPGEPLTNGTQDFEILLLLGNDWHTATSLPTMVDLEPPAP